MLFGDPGTGAPLDFIQFSILQQQDIICIKMKFTDQLNPFCCGGSRNFSSFLYKMGNTEAIVCWRPVSSDLQTHVPLFCADEVKEPTNINIELQKAMRSFKGSWCLFAERRYPSSERPPLTSATARQMLPGLYSFPGIEGIL